MNTKLNSQNIAVVVIGRNEGERLINCLKSILQYTAMIVYVDSGSTDNSIQNAQHLGIDVISLDLSTPFTAARARNDGANFLVNHISGFKYIQFVDGDCGVQPGWFDKGFTFLEHNSEYAVVCGRRRERFPEHSIYNQLCDIEWNTVIGDAFSCGGDSLIRLNAFQQVDGFNISLIAGEEPEMCFRMRESGWKIRRINAEMTLHDAAIIKFSQWWNRSKRGGHAFTEGAFLHGTSPERYYVKESLRVLVWGLLIPFIIFITSLLLTPYLLLVMLLYPLQIIRLALRNEVSNTNKWSYAFFLVIGKFPEAVGQLSYVIDRLFSKKGQLIEYK